jgi:ketosteroid isomerase-like protein
MSDSRAQDEAAIQAVLVESYKAWEAGDADGMVADYTADATAVMTGSLRDSREVIRENMALAFEGPLKAPRRTTSSSASASWAGMPRSPSASPASCSPVKPMFRTLGR